LALVGSTPICMAAISTHDQRLACISPLWLVSSVW
jgi:hypothetical protein